MADKLDEIMAWKRREIAGLVASLSATEGDLARIDAALPRPPSFAQALTRADGAPAVIAEIKRKSPSAGAIAPGASSVEQALRYQAAGADALSVLTDHQFFGGTLTDLSDVVAALRAVAGGLSQGGARGPHALFDVESGKARGDHALHLGSPPIPCLRKDFFIHPVQIRQAREAGASAILIIVRALTDDEIKTLQGAARAAGLDALYEIHSEPELERAVRHGARIIGVNNRDLAIFRTDLALSERLIPLLPSDAIGVSESGIFVGTDAARAVRSGARALLVGEALMRAPEPGRLIQEFRDAALSVRDPGRS
ncbi:MAG TPA: indole-3-glycerol phosphate synthase TrpC [Opitutaceae bacterium]|jgi:indole-3-glycerol phosphate synthase